jgi:hypothetical protein
MGAERQDAGSKAAVPADASELSRYKSDRSRYYFRSQMRKPLTWIGGSILAIAVGFYIASEVTPWVGVIGGPAVAALAVAFIVSVKASRRAADDFLRAYANARGLVLSDRRGTLPPVTSLLQEGADHRTDWTLTGRLPGGPDGVLAYYSYVTGGARDTKYAEESYYTVVFCQLPEVSTVVTKLAVCGDGGFKKSIKDGGFKKSIEHNFGKRQRVETESAEFDEKFEAFIGEQDDMNMARQIFEPTFIVWLTENPDLYFELNSGALCVAVWGLPGSAEGLDALCAAAGVIAKRLTEEAEEAAPAATAKPVS